MRMRSKALSGVLSGLFVSSVFLSSASVFAATTHAEESEHTVLISLADRNAWDYATDVDEALYPHYPYLLADEVVLKSDSGTSYESDGCEATLNRREYTFRIPEADWARASSFTVTVDANVADFAHQLSDSELESYSFEFSDTRDSAYTFKKSDMTQTAKYVSKEKDPEGYQKYLDSLDDPILRDFAEQDSYYPVDDGSCHGIHLMGTTSKAGLCSIYIADLPDEKFGYFPGEVWETRGTATPNIISSIDFYDGDKLVSSSYPNKDGVIYFTTPTKWDAELEKYVSYTDLRMEITGFERNMPENIFAYTATEQLAAWEEEAYQASLQNYILYRDFDLQFQDEVQPEESHSEPELYEQFEDGEISGFDFYIQSSLGKYKTDLVSDFDDKVTVMGKATETYLQDNDRLQVALGADVAWDSFHLADGNTVKSNVDAGTYKLSTSDLIKLKYDGKLKAKKGKTSEVTLTATPAYTLKVKSVDDSLLNYEIFNTSYKNDKPDDFIVAPDVSYMVYDKTSGKTYEAKATKSNPNVVIELGSDKGVVDVEQPTSFEDVPNTADPITTVLIVMGAVLVLLAGSFVAVYAANKKAERRK